MKESKDVKGFIEYCSMNAKKPTLTKIKRKVEIITEFYKGKINNLDLKELQRFLVFLNASNYAGVTINDTHKVLRRFLKWKYKDYQKRFNNFEDIKPKRVQQTKQDLLSADDIEKLIRGCKTIMHTAIINLLYESGIRPNELLRLKWKNFDKDKRKIKVFSSKNNTTRIIPLNTSALSLNDWRQKYSFKDIRQDDYIFPSPNNREKSLTIQSISQYIHLLGKNILKKDISPYTFRHTRCNIWFNSGMNPKDYELVADHSFEVAMQYYQQSNEERLTKKFEEIYNIKELTPEEKDEIKSLKEQILIDRAFTITALNLFVKNKKAPTEAEVMAIVNKGKFLGNKTK